MIMKSPLKQNKTFLKLSRTQARERGIYWEPLQKGPNSNLQ